MITEKWHREDYKMKKIKDTREWEVIEGEGPEITYRDKKTGEYRNMFGDVIKTEDDKTYIYESPDGGKTLYRREFGKSDKERISE